MRLINTKTLVLEEYFGDRIPKYAILSHAWRDEEVTYQDWQHSDRGSAKQGFRKIQAACHVSQRHSLSYLWMDTNCINKESSAELSEAINSMFAWYQRSSACFVYLDDFHYDGTSLSSLGSSRWFTRGWTLQELLAPRTVQFFDHAWTECGTRQSLMSRISGVTSIPMQYLLHPDSIRVASVARKMSWIATRSTTREEDMAYCLLGIFEINMPLLYGEGRKAFIRLQEEIIRHSNDHTIFCWSWPPSVGSHEPLDWRGCLAPSPMAFRESGSYVQTPSVETDSPTDFQLTNSGLRINLPLIHPLYGRSKIAVLNARDPTMNDTQLCLCLEQSSVSRILQPLRDQKGFATLASSNLPNRSLSIPIPRTSAYGGTPVYLAHERDPDRKISNIFTGSVRRFESAPKYAILPIMSASELEMLESIEPHHNTQGPLVALDPTDEENIWRTQFSVKILPGSRVKIDFVARITQLQGADWDAMILLYTDGEGAERETQATTQNIELSHDCEFSVESHGAATLVRPVWISISEFQAQYLATYSQGDERADLQDSCNLLISETWGKFNFVQKDTLDSSTVTAPSS